MPILPLITKHSDRVKQFMLMFGSLFSYCPNRHKYHFDWPKRPSYSTDTRYNSSSTNEGLEVSTKDRLPLQDRDNSITPLTLTSGNSQDSRVEY